MTTPTGPEPVPTFTEDTSGDRTPEKRTVRIWIDDRELRSGVPAALERIPGVEIVVAHLRSGDYVVEDRCFFERKTVPDFVESVIDQRLFRQARRLANSGRPAAVILEGTEVDWEEAGMRREALQGALISLGLVFALPVLRSRDVAETARMLVFAARQMWRVTESEVVRRGRRPRGRRRQQLYLLQGLPGVGPHRAARLLDRFGSVAAVMAAGSRGLRSVEGLGAVTADRIEQLLRSGWKT